VSPGPGDAAAFRAEVRDWLAAHVPAQPLPPVDTAEGFARHREWERELAAARLAVVSWPAEYGGRGASLLEWLVFEDEYHAAAGPARVGQNGLFLLAPTLFAHGTAAQRDRLLPRMATADDVWAQAWSEPDAGSDLAAIRARATRSDGGWLLSGAKTWSSRAAFADRAFGLFRTDPGAGRHHGLTYLLFDLRAEGVEGWRIAMSTASHERGLSLRSPGRFCAAAARLVELWQRAGDPADTALRDRVTDAWIGARAYRLHTFATASRLDAGAALGPESSLGKVFWSELDVGLHETALDLLGPQAELAGRPAPDGRWLGDYLFSLAGPIYAGTNEIQRTVIAERLLGLPR